MLVAMRRTSLLAALAALAWYIFRRLRRRPKSISNGPTPAAPSAPATVSKPASTLVEASSSPVGASAEPAPSPPVVAAATIADSSAKPLVELPCDNKAADSTEGDVDRTSASAPKVAAVASEPDTAEAGVAAAPVLAESESARPSGGASADTAIVPLSAEALAAQDLADQALAANAPGQTSSKTSSGENDFQVVPAGPLVEAMTPDTSFLAPGEPPVEATAAARMFADHAYAQPAPEATPMTTSSGKPNLSGNWKIVRDDADPTAFFKDLGAGWLKMKTLTLVKFGVGKMWHRIEHKGDSITIAATGPKGTFTQNLVINGQPQETVDTANGERLTMTPSWEGSTLVITSTQGGAPYVTFKRYLRENDLILEMTSPNGVSLPRVMERQDD